MENNDDCLVGKNYEIPVECQRTHSFKHYFRTTGVPPICGQIYDEASFVCFETLNEQQQQQQNNNNI